MKFYTFLLATALNIPLFAIQEVKKENVDTFKHALIEAYKTNPDFLSANSEYLAQLEQETIAMSDFLPNITANAGYNKTETSFKYTDSEAEEQDEKANNNKRIQNASDMENQLSNKFNTINWGLGARLNIFKGLSSIANLSKTQYEIFAQAAKLKSAESKILNDAITVYMDCLTKQKALESYIVSEQSMNRTYAAATTKFQVGEIPKSELLQAQAGYESAKANRIRGEGELETSRATYQKIIGSPPGKLKLPILPKEKIPASLDEASEISLKKNPMVIQAKFAEKAISEGWIMSFSEFLPTVDLTYDYKQTWSGPKGSSDLPFNTVASENPLRNHTYGISGQWSLFNGFASVARFNQTTEKMEQAKFGLESTRRSAIEAVTKSWRDILSAKDEIVAQKAAVVATALALEGFRQGERLGAYSMLNVLDTEDKHVKAQVALAQAQQKEVLGVFNFLNAIGSLSAQELGLIEEIKNLD